MKNIRKRYLHEPVREDLTERLVFIGGPRQVGKTTFALSFLKDGDESHPAYMNWDDAATRATLLRGELPPEQPLVILDEIHKFARWRNLVKGFYDTSKSTTSFLIAGSARLDYYRKGGDSLQGRYHYYRLHPFTLPELSNDYSRSDLDLLLRYGGFPEPCLRSDERFWRRWQKERLERVVYDDVRDLENIREISLLELLGLELPNRVGSPLSVAKLKQLLQVSHATVERWLTILERMYYIYRVAPYGSPRIRAVKKERKLYLWDWSLVEDEGPRFENMVAGLLLKHCHFLEDTEGLRMELRFLRDTDGREVDFVLLQEGRPLMAVECKSGDKKINPAIYYYRDRTDIPAFYQVHNGRRDYVKDGIRVLPLTLFSKELRKP